jgi:hypothetical protein
MLRLAILTIFSKKMGWKLEGETRFPIMNVLETWSKSYNRELQRKQCKNLQSHE